MTAKATVVKYTAEQTVELVSAYKENPTRETVDTFADKFKKSPASIIAKLSKEGVYKKAEPVTKTGEAVISKEDLADEIAKFMPDMDENSVSSLAKANKKILKGILKMVSELSDFKKSAMQQFDDSVDELTESENQSTIMADEMANFG